MAITQDTIYTTKNNIPFPVSYGITDALQLYVGAVVDLTAGLLVNHAASGLVVGMVVRAGQPGNDPNMFTPLLGDVINDGLGGTLYTQAVVETGEFDLIGVPVTGLTYVQGDVGTAVYATDNGTWANAGGGGEKPFGFVIGLNAGANLYDIHVYSAAQRKGL